MNNQQTVKPLSNMEKVQVMETMAALYDNPSEDPEVGLFFYDARQGVFGEYALPASDSDCRRYVLSINHEMIWQKKHNRAVVKGNTSSPFYDCKPMANIPRGRVVVRPGERFCIVAGRWLDEHPEAIPEILDAFCLPKDTIHSYHPDYDIIFD